MALHRHDPAARDEALSLRPQFASLDEVGEVPRHRLRQEGMPAELAYQVVHDELMLDGHARLNLATFVTTWMEPAAERLMAECAPKNLIDKDEYPRTAELERRCVSILAELWHAPRGAEAVGCSTVGSSEACMLAGLALLHRWRRRTGATAGSRRPNLVLGANAQVCWEKFCRYFDVEARLVPVGGAGGGSGCTHLTPAGALGRCDEDTIGVVAILGSTYDGAYEPVAEIAAALDRLEAGGGPDVPVHVDGASGGFLAPFLDPDLAWDFRLARVQSINASGHKYGLVYPGVGWALWRDRSALPEELVFDVDYLGGTMPTFTLNFSRPGAQVAAQYYTFLRLGSRGYREVHAASRATARWLAARIGELEQLELVSGGEGVPVVAFRVEDAEGRGWSVFDLSDELRAHGWIVPAYRMPPALDHVAVARVVVRNGFSRDLAELFLADLRDAVDRLEARRPGGPARARRVAFHH